MLSADNYSCIDSRYNPTWMETKFVLVNSLAEVLNLNLYDFNDHRKDTLLGTTTFELAQLQEEAVHEGLTSQLLKDGKDRGELKYDISFYPVLKPQEGQDAPDTSELMNFMGITCGRLTLLLSCY